MLKNLKKYLEQICRITFLLDSMDNFIQRKRMSKKPNIRNIIFDIGGVLFSYNDRNAVYFAVENPINNPFEPIEHGLKILQNCFDNKNNKDIKLFVLSNWNVGPFNLLTKHYPEPFKLFDGIVISGTTGFKKP